METEETRHMTPCPAICNTDKEQCIVRTQPFLISVAVLFSMEVVASIVLSTGIMSQMMTQEVMRVLEIALFILIFRHWGEGLASLNLEFHQLLPGLKTGLIWSMGFGVLVLVVTGTMILFCGINPFERMRVPFPEKTQTLLSFLLLRCVIGPVAEEIFFRGILYGFLRRWGMFIAIFLSSLLFVLAHPVSGLPQVVGAILFAVAYEVEKKLMVPITIHVLGNIAIFAVSALF